jgi:hypothetical protein
MWPKYKSPGNSDQRSRESPGTAPRSLYSIELSHNKYRTTACLDYSEEGECGTPLTNDWSAVIHNRWQVSTVQTTRVSTCNFSTVNAFGDVTVVYRRHQFIYILRYICTFGVI